MCAQSVRVGEVHSRRVNHVRRISVASAMAVPRIAPATAPRRSTASPRTTCTCVVVWGVAAWPASGAKPDKKKSPSTHSPFFSLLLIDLAEEASATAALRMDASAAAAPGGATWQFQPVCHGCSSMQTARWGVQAQDRLSSMRPRRASMAAWQHCTRQCVQRRMDEWQ